jgi:hypothetical protein
MRNSKQTLVFNFNSAVTAEHVLDDDDDESSNVLIGKIPKNVLPGATVDFIYT